MNITLIILLFTYDLQNHCNTVFEIIMHKDLKALKKCTQKKTKSQVLLNNSASLPKDCYGFIISLCKCTVFQNHTEPQKQSYLNV